MTVKDLWAVIERELKDIKQVFSDFKTNDFLHLEQRVDNLALKVYIGIGIIMTLEFVILAKILS